VAPRWPLEADFELFRTLVAKWLPDGLWRRILSSSGFIAHKYSWICVFRPRASGFLPLAADWPTCRSRWPLEVHFELFWAHCAKIHWDLCV
jgi:hypothetical protein